MEEDGVRVQVDTIMVPHLEDFLVGEVVAEEFLVEHVLPLDSGAPVEDRYVLMYLMCILYFRLFINDFTLKLPPPCTSELILFMDMPFFETACDECQKTYTL